MIKNFLRDETGLELSEYAVAAALVAIACVVAFGSLVTAIAVGSIRLPQPSRIVVAHEVS